MGVDLSQPTCKAIEAEFQLIPSQQRRQNQHLPIPESTQKLDPASSEPVSEAVNRVVATIMKHYHFTDLPEYNAILRAYNVTAETGAPGSKTHRYNGLYYVALDDHGNRVSPPIMASRQASGAGSHDRRLRCGHRQPPAARQTEPPTEGEPAPRHRFSANVPQVLSAVLHTTPAGPDRFGQD